MNSFADYFLFSIVVIIGIGLAWAAIIIWGDRHQKNHAILINFPLVGHLRYRLENMGKYLRQYWFTNDNEERPFSRSVRSQVYRMSKSISNNLSFGSTSAPKSEVFRNALFPLEKSESEKDRSWVIGSDCEIPFVQTKMFNISGMSFGALSANAISALSQGAAEAGLTMNTGEGGRPSKFHRTPQMSDPNAKGGLVVQIGTSNFGYRNDEGRLDYDKIRELREDQSCRALQIKVSQGAKPGKGGILPGEKVTQEIAELRGVPVGKDCISPCKNPDCATPGDLLRTIRKLKQVSGKPVGIKVALASVDELQELIEMAIQMDEDVNGEAPSHLPSTITVDGGDGGTGSAPALFMESLAVPVRDIISQVDQMLDEAKVRDKIHLVASGRLVTAHDVAAALALGADSVESGRGFLMSIGCINALSCASGDCPAGITTQDERLQRALVPEVKAKRVIAYAENMEKELFDLALACGVPHPADLSIKHLVFMDDNQKPKIIAKS